MRLLRPPTLPNRAIILRGVARESNPWYRAFASSVYSTHSVSSSIFSRIPEQAAMGLIEDRNLQRQRRQWSPTGAPALARRSQAGCRVPSGAEAPQERFPEAARPATAAIWHGQKSWDGVAILACGLDPVEGVGASPAIQTTHNSRCIEASIDGVLVACLYLPNGNPAPGQKFDYKLRWFARLTQHADSLLATAARRSRWRLQCYANRS
jgi:hypothetical protein